MTSPIRILVALLVFTLPVRPAQTQTKPEPNKPVLPLPDPVEQEQFIAYWTTESGWMTELQLRNNLKNESLVVTPFLRTPDGSEVPLHAVELKPEEVKSINLDDARRQAAQPFGASYGAITLRYRAVGLRPLYAAAMIRSMGHPFEFHIDGMGTIENYEAAGREGIWWLPRATTMDYLILTNQGDKAIDAHISVSEAQGRDATQNVKVGPRQTARYSVGDLVRSAGLRGTFGGITVFAPAHAGALDTVHFTYDYDAEFSALLKMFDHDPNVKLDDRDFSRNGTWTLRAPMLALSDPDPALAFPSATSLQPAIFLRNTSNKPLVASLRFNWYGSSTSGAAQGPTLTLRGGETVKIDVSSLQNDIGIPAHAHWASVTLKTSAKPDELVAIASSFDSSLRYGLQTPFSDQLAYRWEGGQWEYDPRHDSIVTVGNGGTAPARAALTIFYNQGSERYDTEQLLQPEEQMWVNIGKIIHDGIPDKNGNRLPADLSSGSYEIRDLTDHGTGSLFEGKIIYDKTFGHAAYGCAVCCYYQRTALDFNPLGIPFGAGGPNGVEALDSCAGVWDEVSYYFQNHWSTANTAIATVNGQGYHSGINVGTTSSSTYGNLISAGSRYTCPVQSRSASGGDGVIKLDLQGNDYNSLFVGTDPNLSTANTIFASVSPTGGTYTKTSSNSGDTFTDVTTGFPGWVVRTTTQSTSVADRKITVKYTVSGQGSVSKSLNLTARQFAYLTNDSPTNTCTLGYGTTRVYVYTPFTHPDKTAVQPNVGLSNTPVTEAFNPQPPAGTITGDGTLNANSQFTDRVSYCSTAPLPTSTTVTQTISIAGYQVRQNQLAYSSSGVALTNQGPTQ